MATIYIVTYEGELGEAQGVFDQDNEIIDYWWCNDAIWRHEYFNPFMAELGVEVKPATPEQIEIFENFLIQEHGYTADEEYVDDEDN